VKYFLAPRHRPALTAFARGPVLLAFDFDGTLAPIVFDPRKAAMRDTTRALLKRVARRYPVAVLSGRSRDDLLPRVANVPLVDVVGNHGMEWAEGVAPEARRLRQWAPRIVKALERALQRIDGAWVEDKGPSLTVHYRGARHPKQAERAVRRALVKLGAPVRAMHGKCSVNIVPLHSPNKGTALARLMEKHGAPGALFAGDDVTDEDAFALAGGEPVVSVRIRHARDSKAEYFVKSQCDIDKVLQLLLDARSGAGRTVSHSERREKRSA
jgi:trehalose 6-phosphate phosphatase